MVTSPKLGEGRRPSTHASRNPSGPTRRVGLFGLLGSGNLGNDASFEVVLSYLRTEYPEAVVDAMCLGPERLKAQYGIDTVALQSYRHRAENASRTQAIVLKLFGKAIDAYRTASWTRRHDVVIVPGMGVLETSLPLRATGMPYALFLLSASGKLFGTKVAMVSVGATQIAQRPTRWLFNTAARLAFYRSYRDAGSLDAMRQRGVCSPDDRVYPDLVFGLRIPEYGPGDPDTVGVGVMAYYGGNDDRKKADEIYARYVGEMKRFVRWLVDTGYQVRLFWGDDVDTVAVEEIVSDLRAHRPDVDPACVAAEPYFSLRDLMKEMAPVGTVVGIRYHNVLSALKLSKPTIAIGYSAKHDDLMADMGMSEFTRSAKTLDADELIAQFTELKSRAPELRERLLRRNRERLDELDEQFAMLSSQLFSEQPRGGKRRLFARHRRGAGNDRRNELLSSTNGPSASRGSRDSREVQYYKNDFWKEENTKYTRPHYRLEKAAKIVNAIAGARDCDLLDVGCGPATLERMLNPNISYYGIDIAVQDPAPNLLEADIIETPIRFDDKRFDIVVAQGLFEYLGDHQSKKFAEIREILEPDGTFVTSYVNFGHRRCNLYWPYSNMQSIEEFRESLSRDFVIRKWFPAAHNWRHSEPNRNFVKSANMHFNVRIPFVTSKLAVEYFFICTPRHS